MPHQADRLFLTDGGIETWLTYKQGFEPPHFCSLTYRASRDRGRADELAGQHRELARLYPHINVFGGCCGTDFIHVRKICEALRH